MEANISPAVLELIICSFRLTLHVIWFSAWTRVKRLNNLKLYTRATNESGPSSTEWLFGVILLVVPSSGSLTNHL